MYFRLSKLKEKINILFYLMWTTFSIRAGGIENIKIHFRWSQLNPNAQPLDLTLPGI